MPKAAMDEYHLLAGVEDEVRSPRKCHDVQAVSVSDAIQETAYNQFRLGVGASDATHLRAALGSSQSVGHNSTKSLRGTPHVLSTASSSPVWS